MKSLLFFALLFVWGKNIEAQNIHPVNGSLSFNVDTVFTAVNAKEDLITITVSNPALAERRFVLEIVAVEQENSYWGTIYSAAVNEDYFFFKQWHDGKKLAQKANVRFALPPYNKIYQTIGADEAKDLSFKITGMALQRGIPVQFRVTSLDNNETGYSQVFQIYKQPN